MKKDKNLCFLLLGGNLKNRQKQIEFASFLINESVGAVVEKSRIYESEPWGVSRQQNYFNRALKIKTDRSALEVLDICLRIETMMGRRRLEKYGARTIDIDLLFYENEIIETGKLIIPHPRLHLRNFVLKPLNEIAPHFLHPVFKKTIKELLEECTDTGEVVAIN